MQRFIWPNISNSFLTFFLLARSCCLDEVLELAFQPWLPLQSHKEIQKDYNFHLTWLDEGVRLYHISFCCLLIHLVSKKSKCTSYLTKELLSIILEVCHACINIGTQGVQELFFL